MCVLQVLIYLYLLDFIILSPSVGVVIPELIRIVRLADVDAKT